MKKVIPLTFTLLLFGLSQSSLCQSQSNQTNPQSDCVATDQGCARTPDPMGQSSDTLPQGNGVDTGDFGTSQRRSGITDNTDDTLTGQRSTATENAPLTRKRTTTPLPFLLPIVPPTEFQNFVSSVTGEKLPIYGASLFRKVPTSFAPSDLNPVSSDYVIGPDDELRVRIWGGAAYSANLRVDRSGAIYIPQVGSVHVAGLKFSQLDGRLRSAIAREYKNFDISVELGRIRSIQVYVTGQVTSPGAYTISSMSTLVDALFASGGPSPQGSLRHLQLKRDGKVVADFDMYGLLLHGDKSGDTQLQAEDVLYVPSAGSQVALVGSVRNPAIYEVRQGEQLGELLTASGGTTSLASQAKISVDRATPGGHREAIELAFDDAGVKAPLSDGDIIRIASSVPSYKDVVTLRGRIANPGHLTWHPGMRLSELIPDRDSLVSRDYWWKRSHLALPSAEFQSDVVKPQPLVQKFQKSLDGSDDAPTVDRLSAAADAEHSASHASLAEESVRPVDAANTEPKLNVRLQGDDIDWNYAVIERSNPDDLKTSLIPFDLGKLVNSHDESQNMELQPGDIVTIFSQSDLNIPLDLQNKYVTVEGEVGHAGTYSVKPGETLTEVVARAGGLTRKAYLYGSEFTRESARKFQQRRIDEYVQEVDLEVRRGTLDLANNAQPGVVLPTGTAAQDRFIEQLKKLRASGRVVLDMRPTASSLDSIPQIELENGDRFIIPSRPATINVVGAVFNPNVFLYKQNGPVGNYLTLAGGANRNADAHKMFIIRADGSVESRDARKGIFGDAFLRAELNPGDTLVIPDKRLRPNTSLKTFLDTTQAFSQLALGAAAVSVLK